MKFINKKKLYGTIIAVILFAIMVIGATFAWLTYTFNATNGSYNTATTCFTSYYQDNGNLSGALDYSQDGSLNLNTYVALGMQNQCTNAKGTISLNVASETSSILYRVVPAHCEDDQLQTLINYTSESSCTTNGGTWVTNGTALKYFVTDENQLHRLSQGYITQAGDNVLYNNFYLFKQRDDTQLTVNYYVYIWLDGNLANDVYNDQPFSGYIHSNITQTHERIPTEYQEVTYVKSGGTQYIITDIVPTNTTGAYTKVKSTNWAEKYYVGSMGTESSRFYIANTGGASAPKAFFAWNDYITASERPSISNTSILHTFELNFLNDRKMRYDGNNLSVSYLNSPLSTNNVYELYIFSLNNKGVETKSSSIELYDLIISLGTDKVIGDFIPCYLKANNTDIGLFDIVSNKFYTNSGTGAFTYGDPVN